MGFNKKFYQTGGLVASTPPSGGGLDPLQNFETVTYTGNGSTQKITGYIRKGAAFNGSSSFIDTNAKIPASLDFSVSFWMKSSDTSTGSHYIFGTKGNYLTNGWFISNDAGYIRYGEGNGVDNATNYSSPSVVANGNWNHVVVTRASGGTINMYVNGSRVITDASVGTYFMTSSTWAYDLHIGRYAASSDLFYDGQLDQVRIFNTALNQTQVGQLALETYADPKKSTTDYFGDGSGVALYELDDSANDTGGTYPYGTGAIDSGQSAVFNGTSYITTPTLPDYRSGFAFSSWVLSDTTQNKFIITQKGTGEYANFAYRLINGKINLITGNGTSAYYINYTAPTALTNGWHNIVVTGTASSISIYVDGAFLTTQTGTAFLNSSNMEHIMGVNYYNGAIDTVGAGAYSLDQFRFFNTALSPSDVVNLVSETNVPTANLVAHYKLDGNALDETTNYNGTWGGTEAYSTPAEFPNVAYNGTATNVNYLGMAFQPDLVWIKSRSNPSWHSLQDSIRGATKTLFSNETSQEVTYSDAQTSFDANGFTLGADVSGGSVNVSGRTYVAWCWKASDTTTTIPAGTVGNTIASDVRANTEAGFSIVKYTGNGIAGATIGHGLSSTPELIIIKNLNDSELWSVYSSPTGNTQVGHLNLPNAFSTSGDWNSTSPTSTVFTVGTSNRINSTDNYIAYCFHSVAGYQKVGSYTGTGASGNTITTGFRPRFILLRRSNTTNNWDIFDSTRDSSTYVSKTLKANSPDAEFTYPQGIYFQDNGFEPENTYFNDSGDTIIYLAIA